MQFIDCYYNVFTKMNIYKIRKSPELLIILFKMVEDLVLSPDSAKITIVFPHPANAYVELDVFLRNLSF